MAQTSVTNFFTSRKRGIDIQPSKRRKVQRLVDDTELQSQTVTEPETSVEKGKIATKTLGPDLKVQELVSSENAAKPQRRSARQSKSAPRATRSRAKAAGQPDIKQFLSAVLCNEQQGKNIEVPEMTSSCDDHNASPPCTPTKRLSAEPSQPTGQKRSRKDKVIRKDLFGVKTPEPFNFAQYTEKSTEKEERLVMKGRRLSEELKSDPEETEASKGLLPVQEKIVQKPATKEVQAVSEKNSEIILTPRKTQKSEKKEKVSLSLKEPSINSKEQPASNISEEVKSSVPKEKSVSLENLSKDAGPSHEKDGAVASKSDIKTVAKIKLSTGKLAELKQKLLEHNKKKAEVEAIKVSRKAKELGEEKAPAYERFHNLALPVPPSLTLPFKYRCLLEMFNNTDTIVSLLHKRNEVCTFSKLKAAVQTMAKKAYEEKMLGQIKSVYPTAYIYRQEKGLPVFGKGRTTSYELTVEANLQDDLKGYIASSKNDEVDKDGRPLLSATRMIERKSVFHRNLLQMVRNFHKDFLSKLAKPLSIPDDKLTRWHPAFKLDEVPDVEVAALPVAPDVKKFNTATEVLQQARINNPRMKAAIEKAAAEASNIKNIEKGSPKANVPTATSNSPANNNTQLKGVSSSLLERIRAKEAMKLESALTRTPGQEQRLQMMGRLPDLVRIVRTAFVTNKKPAIALEEAMQRVTDSYRSSLGQVEAEKHLRLMVELLPDWISIVKIKAGEFIKIDKNKDVNYVINKVNKILKESQ